MGVHVVLGGCVLAAAGARVVVGDVFFKAALLGRGWPEPAPPAGSWLAGVFLQLKLLLVVSVVGFKTRPERGTMGKGVVAAQFLL